MKFTATINQVGNNTGIPIPDEVLEALGAGRRPALMITLNGYTYRNTVGAMDGQAMLSLSKANREAAGVAGGETHEINVELATEPEVVELPEDLTQALKAAGVTEKFEESAPSMSKEYVRQVTSAKAPETQARRIAKIVDTLKAK